MRKIANQYKEEYIGDFKVGDKVFLKKNGHIGTIVTINSYYHYLHSGFDGYAEKRPIHVYLTGKYVNLYQGSKWLSKDEIEKF